MHLVIPVWWSGKWSVAIPAGSLAGIEPEWCMVDRRGKQRTGKELEGRSWAGK